MRESQAHNTLGDEVREYHFLEEGAGLETLFEKACKPSEQYEYNTLQEVDDQEISVQDVYFRVFGCF